MYFPIKPPFIMDFPVRYVKLPADHSWESPRTQNLGDFCKRLLPSPRLSHDTKEGIAENLSHDIHHDTLSRYYLGYYPKCRWCADNQNFVVELFFLTHEILAGVPLNSYCSKASFKLLICKSLFCILLMIIRHAIMLFWHHMLLGDLIIIFVDLNEAKPMS